MSAVVLRFPRLVGCRGRAMGRLGNKPSIFLPFNCSGASMVDNAFFIVGWLLVLVLSLDRKFLAGIRAKVATVLRSRSPIWGKIQGRPVAFSLNPLLLKLALQQKWLEIRTISRQRFRKLCRPAGGDSKYSPFSFNTWPIPSSSG
jgi:hypothetical protein